MDVYVRENLQGIYQQERSCALLYPVCSVESSDNMHLNTKSNFQFYSLRANARKKHQQTRH